MKKIAIIPSRYGSSRFPGKPLALIKGKPMIEWVVKNISKCKDIDDIYVATDDQKIFDVCESLDIKAIMTSDKHLTGTDRIGEVARKVEADLIVNIQGDEPLIKAEMVQDLYSCFDSEEVYMGTLKKKIEVEEELDNPNVVKVINDVNDYAIYFSRFCLPFERDGKKTTHFKHIGAYGYKVWFLKQYSKMAKTPLEISESLEQLRVLENGYKIRVKETKHQTVGVDTPEQVKQVEEELRKAGL